MSGERTTGTAIRDGRRLHWTSVGNAGNGSPTVLLEAGIGATSSEWDLIIEPVAAFTKVVAYDRIGYRDGGPADVSAATALLDLEAALEDTGSTGPLVLVGHSWGGVLNRLYTAKHPARVAAVVLVDATHEGMSLLRNPLMARLGRAAMAAQLRRARRGSLLRALEAGKGELGRMLIGLPEPLRTTLLDELSSPGIWEQARRELRAVEPSLRSVPATMPDIPVIAVVGTRATSKTEARMRSMTHAAYEAWLPTLSLGRLTDADNSGHAVPLQDPELLVQVIHEACDASSPGSPGSPRSPGR